MNTQEINNYIKAGEIAKQVTAYAKSIIKPDMLLVDIAKKIHLKIRELNAEPAFPVNLSIDDIAAHYHPTINDKTKAQGLLKVDIGIHINGFIADTAFTLDLTPDNKHKEIIQANEQALTNALDILKNNPTLNEIGEIIQDTIQEKGFSPIINLSGHSLDKYDIHAGITIPNYANGNQNKLDSGAFAIEPFATYGEGKVYEAGPSNILKLENPKNTRNPKAREIISYIMEKYKTLPFALREIEEKFGAISRLILKQLEQENIIHNFPQLIEKSHKPVSQAEHTFIKKDDEIVVTTR